MSNPHLNIAGIAKSLQDDPANANIARLMKSADDVAAGRTPDVWDLTARDVSDLMSAYALSKRAPSETIAHAFGRLMIANDERMNKLFAAHERLIQLGHRGEPAVQPMELERSAEVVSINAVRKAKTGAFVKRAPVVAVL